MDSEIELKKSDDIHIEIKVVEKKEFDGLHESYMKLLFEGSDINIKIINAIRRTSMTQLPSYGFAPELIKIDKNTCEAFNNDYVRQRLCFVPLYNIDSELCYLDTKYIPAKYNNPDREVHPKEKDIELYVNAKNTTSEIIDVTTNNVKILINDKDVQIYNKEHPCLLIKLQPNDKFNCSMKAVLGIGEKHALWNLATNCFYKIIAGTDGKNDKYEITLEGNGQVDEKQIYIKCCKNIIYKLNIIDQKLKEFENIEDKKAEIKLENEDHTIGEILNYELQSINDTVSGFKRPDLLVKEGVITIATKEKKIIDVFHDAITILIKKMSHIGKCIESI